MRTILAALALTLVLSASALAQSIIVRNAEYRLGMTLEEVVKTSKLWGQRLQYRSDVKGYAVYGSTPGKPGETHLADIGVENERVVRITGFSTFKNLFAAYGAFTKYLDNVSEKHGAANSVDIADIEHLNGNGQSASITVEGDTWEAALTFTELPDKSMSYEVRLSVWKKK